MERYHLHRHRVDVRARDGWRHPWAGRYALTDRGWRQTSLWAGTSRSPLDDIFAAYLVLKANDRYWPSGEPRVRELVTGRQNGRATGPLSVLSGGADAVAFIRQLTGIVVTPWQEEMLRQLWEYDPAMTMPQAGSTAEDARSTMMPQGHQVNVDSDQFTPMNTDGTEAGLPHAPHYGGPSVPDQAADVNPSAGDQGPIEAGMNDVNPQGPAPSGGSGPFSDRQVFPDTSQGYPK